MFAIELSASIFCAREMRGTMSMAMAVMPCSRAASSSSAFCAGQKWLMRVWPRRIWAISAISGGRTLTTTSTSLISAAAVGSTVTPAA